MDAGTVKLKTAYYITCEDVEKLTGKRWDAFEFVQMAENDSYQMISCSDEALEELYEDFEDVKDEMESEEYYKENPYEETISYPCRLKNQIKLIEILRKQYGCRSTVLIWISW